MKTANETEHRVFLERSFNTSAIELYNWFVEPSLLAQWFGPQNTTVGKVETDVRVGGRYSIELNFEAGGGFKVVGQYEVLQSPHLLAFTFQYEGLPNPAPNSLVTIRLQETSSEQTVVSFTQAFELEPDNMQSRTVAWNYMFDLLGALASATN